MATQTFEQLIAGADKIKHNQLPESNTSGLVGEQLIKMINKQKEEKDERLKGIAEYNVSVQHPTGGVGNSEKYTFESAIQHVPNNLRRRAIKCAFIGADGKSYIYEYQGGTYTDKASWLRVDGEEIHSQRKAVESAKEEALNKINQQKVTPDMLSQETKDLINASGGGTITNNADGTDLASAQVNGASVIRFADRKHEPSKLNGLGRVYLRADIVQGKRVLTQEMVSDENTVYVVRDDFDLNGATINVPAKCTLQFEGGSISNGVLVGNRTKVITDSFSMNRCKYQGTFTSNHAFEISSICDVEGVNIPQGIHLHAGKSNYNGTFVRDDSKSNNIVSWENNDGQKYKYLSNRLVVDHFGCNPDDPSAIDNNSRIVEKLTQYRLPIQFLSGTYYLRNIDCNKYNQRLFSFTGLENDAYGLSGIDSYSSSIYTDGGDLFRLFTTVKDMHTINLNSLKFKSKDYTGEVCKICNDSGSDLAFRANSCYFQGFDAVVRSKHYGTNLTVEKCLFRNCRTAISYDMACNLAYIFACNFLNVGQCIKVYGSNCRIIKTEINCLYTGPDWESLFLYAFYVSYNALIDEVYFEPYGSHDSAYRFNILVKRDTTYNTIICRSVQFPRLISSGGKKITHLRVIGVKKDYPFNNSLLRFYGGDKYADDGAHQYPSFIIGETLDGQEFDIFASNMLYNDKEIKHNKYIVGGLNGIPLSIKETAMKCSNRNLSKFDLLYENSAANLYDTLIPEELKTNHNYYFNTNSFCVFNGEYNIDLTLNVNDSPDGLIDIYLNYRKPDGTRDYMLLGITEIKKGKCIFIVSKRNVQFGNQYFCISIGKRMEDDSYAKINAGTPFDCTLQIDLSTT